MKTSSYSRHHTHKTFLLALICSICISPSSTLLGQEQTSEQSDQKSEASHLKYFGFTLIDVYWDDPHDESDKTNYLDEVAAFSNLADILVVTPEDDLMDRIEAMDDVGVGAVLHISELFFEKDGTKAPSGHKLKLRTDHAVRWKKFVAANQLTNRKEQVAAFYVGEEPTWNGISARELKTACDTIKSTIPSACVMIVEAFPALKDLVVPESADWIGFDHYFIKDVSSSKIFQDELALLKSKRSAAHQRIVLIPDAHFIPKVHKHFGVSRADMVSIAKAYYQVAKNDPEVVALLCYFWPGGFDDAAALGTRQMEEVKAAYQKIGREIVGVKE